MLFMRECDESMAADTESEGQQLRADRTRQGGPVASEASQAYSEALCPQASQGLQVPPDAAYVDPPAKAHWESAAEDVTQPDILHGVSIPPLSQAFEDATHPPLSEGDFRLPRPSSKLDAQPGGDTHGLEGSNI